MDSSRGILLGKASWVESMVCTQRVLKGPPFGMVVSVFLCRVLCTKMEASHAQWTTVCDAHVQQVPSFQSLSVSCCSNTVATFLEILSRFSTDNLNKAWSPGRLA